MTISRSSAKAKGRLLQQQIRDMILREFPQLTADDIESCPMSSRGLDLALSKAAQEVFPYAVECKARKSLAAYEWLRQAMGYGRTPILFSKGDRKPPLVTMFAVDFFDLLAKSRKTGDRPKPAK